jgi:hypothetical protein
MSGGGGSSSNQQTSSGSQSSAGNSASSSNPQLTPQQLVSLYQTSLPTIASTVGSSASSSPYSASTAAANTGAAEGVNAINLNGLSPGEANSIERSTNQSNLATGNLGNSNATNTISNAMNFGGAFNSKLGLLNNATNAASTASNAGSTALGNTASMFTPIASNATASNSKSNSLFSSAGSSSGQGSGSGSSFNLGCFLTTVVCEWKGLPDNCDELTTLRHFRDTFVPPTLVEEYYKIAPKIVEKIKNNHMWLSYIWETVEKCVNMIKHNENEKALESYKHMVNLLKNLI